MTKPTKLNADEDAVQRLLHDIDVELNIAYADPNRILFPELSPHYARLVDHPLVERLTLSAQAAEDSAQGQNFRRYVSEALQRASNISLGTSRTLLLVDLAHHVAAEVFSDLLWRRLLWRADQLRLPIWLGDLAMRLEEWQINLSLDKREWKRLIEAVEPLGFESMLRWSFLQAGSMSPTDRQSHLEQLMSIAVQRLRHDSKQFLADEVDPLETQHRLYDFLLDKWNWAPTQTDAQAQNLENERYRDALRLDIERTQHVRDDYIATGGSNDEVDSPFEMT